MTSSLSLSALTGSNGLRIAGASQDDGSGIAVSRAGDINGDGFDDLIIGASYADPLGTNTGAAYVVFGKAAVFGASLSLSALDGNNGFGIRGVAADDWAGASVSDAGDVNGDGFADLLIGAHKADLAGADSGAAYVVFGKAGGFASALALSSLDGNQGFRLSGASGGNFAGKSVSSAGDFNGDGFDDVLVGANGATPAGGGSGVSYIVFGKSTGFASSLALSALDGINGFQLSSATADEGSAYAVSGTGDVNGDGFDDVVIGAFNANANGYGSGTGYVVFGQASGFGSNLLLSALNGSQGFRLRGAAADDRAGFSVGGAGDINGDGFDDVLVGACYASPGGRTGAGSSYVVFGKAGGFASAIELGNLDGSDGFRIAGVAAQDYAGRSLAGAGDVNGDGFDDLIIGAPYANPDGSLGGGAYLVFGKAAGFVSSLDLSTLDGSNGLRLVGATAGDTTGWAVRGAGDVDGDGFDDVLIGAPRSAAGGPLSGASYLVLGGNFNQLVTHEGTAGADTLNGTGGDDVFISGAGADLVLGLQGNDTLRLGLGNDTADGGDGNDRIDGDAGNDSLSGSIGFDTLYGGDGNDVLRGGDQGDKLFGGDGNDAFFGGKGLDTIDGGNGDDTLAGLVGNDVLIGGNGIDTADYSASDAVTVNLLTGTGRSTVAAVGAGSGLDSLVSIENVTGSAFGDSIAGDNLSNRLIGLSGADTMVGIAGFDFLDGGDGDDNLNGGLNGDTLLGGLGNDVLGGGNGLDSVDGGDGNDTLTGGLGNDTLTGGAGADRFRYVHALNASINVDTLTDFASGSDVMELSASIFGAFSDQIGQTMGVNGTTLLYDSATGALSYDADGAGGTPAINFAIIGVGTHPLSMGSDFVIVG